MYVGRAKLGLTTRDQPSIGVTDNPISTTYNITEV